MTLTLGIDETCLENLIIYSQHINAATIQPKGIPLNNMRWYKSDYLGEVTVIFTPPAWEARGVSSSLRHGISLL